MRYHLPGWRIVVGLPLLLMGAIGCWPEPEPTDPTDPLLARQPRATEQILNFPCDEISMAEGDSAALVTLAGVLLAHEVHDCQKLVRQDGQFGPLVGIFPLPDVVGLDNPGAFDTARPIATLFNWGPETYEPLGISRYWTCLWLQRVQRDRDTTWTAFTTPPTQEGCVDGGQPDRRFRRPFAVHRKTYRGDTIPPTARWDWVASNEVHLIGIKCADGWCWIGPARFDTTGLASSGGPMAVPGWDDEQQLAIPDSTGKLIPGPRGRIYPVRNLGSLNPARFADQKQPVAFVTLSGTRAQIAHYDTMWNFKENRRNQVSLIERTTGPTPAENGWFMIVEPGDGSMSEFPVERTEGLVHTVHGAVRWRWDSEDERGWFGCGGACCSGLQ